MSGIDEVVVECEGWEVEVVDGTQTDPVSPCYSVMSEMRIHNVFWQYFDKVTA